MKFHKRPVDKILSKSFEASGHHRYGFDYQTRCGYAHTIGSEIIYEGSQQKIKEFHIFERKEFEVPVSSSLATHDGEMRLEEEGRTCGANRPECSGVSFRFLQLKV